MIPYLYMIALTELSKDYDRKEEQLMYSLSGLEISKKLDDKVRTFVYIFSLCKSFVSLSHER